MLHIQKMELCKANARGILFGRAMIEGSGVCHIERSQESIGSGVPRHGRSKETGLVRHDRTEVVTVWRRPGYRQAQVEGCADLQFGTFLDRANCFHDNEWR
jgi:hypothetical protein